jgi:diacylglycerol kinase family enzyme
MGGDICVILNSGSGPSKGQDRRAEVEAAFAACGAKAEVRSVGKGGDLEAETRRACAEGFGTIVAAGGDGTIATIASCLTESGCRMGVLPFGTFNYFARSLGVPDELDAAARAIVEGETRTLDIGDVNGRIFLNNASIGAYPFILDQRERIYARWGRSRAIAYVAILVSLTRFRGAVRMTLSVDGASREIRTPLLFLSSNARQLAVLGLEGGDCIERGGFAIFVAPPAGRFGLVLYALRLALGLSERREDFELICGREVRVETRFSPRLVARDGERERLASPFVFRLHPGALKVVVPREAAP